MVNNGTMIALSGIENYPYAILFNLKDTPILLQENNQLLIRENGYILKVESGKLTLFAWRVL